MHVCMCSFVCLYVSAGVFPCVCVSVCVVVGGVYVCVTASKNAFVCFCLHSCTVVGASLGLKRERLTGPRVYSTRPGGSMVPS